MLAVGVDAAAERVAALVRLAVAGGDAGAQAAVLAERDDDRTAPRARRPPSRRSSRRRSRARPRRAARVASSASTAGRFSSSFQAGMNTTVSGRELIARRVQRRAIGVVLASRRQPPSRKGTRSARNRREVATRSTTSSRRARGSSSSRRDSPSPRGRSGTPSEQVLYFSDMPADIRRKVTLDGTVTEVPEPVVQVQRHDARRRPQPARLRARHELARPRAHRRRARDARLPLAGQGPEQPERRHRPLGRHDLLLRPVVRPLARLRHRARARARLAGRLPHPARRRQDELELVVARGRVRDAERPLLLARRVAAVHQRHAGRATSRSSTSTPTARSRTAGCSSRASARA